ncbi:hypothetical protein EVB87_117 [Rhizobium phage RHph_N28_1]|nr:hypothetical protein EVB87_117 [Rhizobium phage RHph_N28_1]QIG74146.1 hypothetical protein EVC07_118 [Rhizobium phage RHph_N42]QXV73804.1 hypothetical protein [Rhizobium phage RHph_N46]
MATYPDLEGRNVSPEVHDILADTLVRVLTIGYYEMSDQSYTDQTYGFAFDLPNLLIQYDFASLDEIQENAILSYSIALPDDYPDVSTKTETAEEDKEKGR